MGCSWLNSAIPEQEGPDARSVEALVVLPSLPTSRKFATAEEVCIYFENLHGYKR